MNVEVSIVYNVDKLSKVLGMNTFHILFLIALIVLLMQIHLHYWYIVGILFSFVLLFIAIDKINILSRINNIKLKKKLLKIYRA